ncbi:hypothetical protein BOA8489_04000 [Boseongicola aestuarii]|uniref:Uncharacterized protein n=1 Tax=Boseongicola aestuarii TaxID=1470561 RepID=A0A238J6U4_9RHOB|nr:hypothetical protein BOA8489_04000 [Boseongicola aestuarii]
MSERHSFSKTRLPVSKAVTGYTHLLFRRRESVMLRFSRMRSLEKFAAVDASNYNLFNSERSLNIRTIFKLNRSAALTEWRGLGAT